MSSRPEPLDLEGVVFLRRDALADGYTDRAIDRRVRSGEWHRVRRGAYCSSELWRSLSRADQHRVLARAVLRTAHRSTVLSHTSAALEHGAPVWGIDLNVVHVTRTDGRTGRKEAGIVHHRGVLDEDDVAVRGGVRVTSPTRAAIEVTTIAGVEESLVTVNGLLHAGQVSAASLAEMAVVARNWPNSLTTDLVLRLADRRIESVGESRTWHLCWKQHLPMPEPQVKVRDETGQIVARVDFAWPELGVFIEFDGRVKYTELVEEGSDATAVVLAEKRREEQLCILTGWVCIRITWADLANPAATARRIRAVLQSRLRSGA
jgi:Transcriptional regulator, AbiEi antitoxin